MKRRMQKIYICLLTAALLVTVVMCFAACEKNNENFTPVPTATHSPEDKSFAFQLEGSDRLEPGTKATYKVLVKDVTAEYGIVGLDFYLTYNTDIFQYISSQITKSPTDTWWYTEADDKATGRVNCHSCGVEENAVITGDDQYEVTFTFQVKEDAETEKDWLVKIETGDDAMGADFSPSINVIYGTGSEIKRAG